ncbi:MAG: hypothetical protein AAF386_07470 [Pseudomonadota bacterium]
MRSILTISSVLVLAACAGGMNPNIVNFDYNTQTKTFEGEAGSDWTENDIKTNLGGFCPDNLEVKTYTYTPKPDQGFIAISGTCG